MPKKAQKTTVVETTPAPVEVPVKAEKAKTPKEPKAPKPAKEAKTEKAPAPAPVVEEAPKVELVAPVEETPLIDQSVEFLSTLQQIGTMLSALKGTFRSLEKKWSREVKVAQKASSKKKRKSGTRQPSGFVKPAKISAELATFLAKDFGTEMARTDVTSRITEYIRINQLQDKENGRFIHPDAKLQALLKVPAGEQLSYFNLQKYMSPHFAKSVKEETA